jgi:hypothetical protein
MQGREIDLEKLMRQHELTTAVGNMKVNARGDQLGRGGKIVKKREEIVAEYYENNPNTILSYPDQPAPSETADRQEPVAKTKKPKEE